MNENVLAATALNNLIDDERRWKNARLMTIQRARHLTRVGVPVADICAALEIAPATWYRRCQELDAAMSSEGQASTQSGLDQAYAAAWDAAMRVTQQHPVDDEQAQR